MAHTDRCGQADPMPAPVITSARAHTATATGPAPSRWVTAASPRPTAITSGAKVTSRAAVGR